MQVSGFRIYFLEPGYFFSKILSEFRKKIVALHLPSADFVRRFALKFLQDDSFPNLKKALEEKDAPTAFRAAHTLKGVCQNLGFDALYVPSSALTEALRGGSLDGADELFPPVEKEYQRVVEALKALE